MKRLATWALLLLVVTPAAAVAAASSGPRHARPITSAVVMDGQAMEDAVNGKVMDYPAGLRFVARARFGMGMELVNRARQRITLERVLAVRPKLLPVSQIGTRIAKQTIRPCNLSAGTGSCTIIFVRGPFRAVRPAPRPLAPGQKHIVQLNFSFAACVAHNASTAPITRLLITYRTHSGKQINQTLALHSSRVPFTGFTKKYYCDAKG